MEEEKVKVIERRPKVIDINLLPPEYRPRPMMMVLNVALIVIVLAGVGMPYPWIMWKSNQNTWAAQLETQITQTQQQINDLITDPYIDQLLVDIAQAQQQVDQIAVMTGDYQEFQSLYPEWHDPLQTVLDVMPAGITIEFIGQDCSQIMVGGSATTFRAVVEYGFALQDCGVFSQVFGPQLMGMEGEEESLILFQFTLEVGGGG